MNRKIPGIRAFPALVALGVAGSLGACANTVTTTPPVRTLIFKITMRGQIQTHQDVRYVFAIDANEKPNDGPRPYGPWPLENPIIGWDLPFYLIPETQGTARFFNPPIVQPNTWTDLFVYTAAGGQPVLQHWVQVPDPERVRAIQAREPLVLGQDYRLTSSSLPTGVAPAPGTPTVNDTLELTLLLNRYFSGEKLNTLVGKQLEANLVIQARPPATATDYYPSGWKIDQWFANDTEFFSVPLDPARPADRKDALDQAPLYPQNKPAGIADDDVAFKSYSIEFKQSEAGK